MLDKKIHLWFWEHHSLSVNPFEHTASWVPAPDFYNPMKRWFKVGSGHCWPKPLRAHLAHLQLPQGPAQLAEPIICQGSPRRPEHRLFRPAWWVWVSSAPSHRVGFTCFNYILLLAAPKRAAWNKLRELPSKRRLRVNHSLLWTPKHTACNTLNFH